MRPCNPSFEPTAPGTGPFVPFASVARKKRSVLGSPRLATGLGPFRDNTPRASPIDNHIAPCSAVRRDFF